MNSAYKVVAAKKQGQILVLVLLIIVVALAVGLSVAARNITNLRTSAQTEQSQRAFTAAEGGVEDVLSKISKVASDLVSGSGVNSGCAILADQAECTVPVTDDISADVVVKSSSTYESTIELGNVGQIDLTGASGNVQIEWAKCGDPIDELSATLGVTQYFKEPGGLYSQSRKMFQGDPTRLTEFAVDPPGWDNSVGPVACGPGTDFRNSATVALDAPVGSESVMLRIRPFWVKTTVKVTGQNLPTQIYNITSTARTETGITRRIQVSRTALPQLPAVFDYVLFSSAGVGK